MSISYPSDSMEIIYYSKRIEDFINCLDADCLKHLFRSFDRLELSGYSLRMPYSKSLGEGLFELHVPSNPRIRVIFGFYRSKSVIVHIFFKKTMAIPKRDLDYAYDLWKNLVA